MMLQTRLLGPAEIPRSLLERSRLRAGFELEYPFESHWMRVGAHVLHYIDEGTGPVLLMLHGNPTWSFIWRRLVRELSDQFRVIALDHLGCGFSERPRQDLYTLARHIDRLCSFVSALEISGITLIAHDWGGAIGMGCAARIEKRFDRFVLMNTAAFPSRRIPLRIAVCRIPVLGTLGVRALNLFSLAALKMAVTRPLPPAVAAGLTAPYDSWNNRIAVQEFVRDIPLAPSHRSYATLSDVEQSLERFRDRPVQFIWGMRDWCFSPVFLEEFKRRFPRARVREIDSAGHYVFEDAPAEVIEACREFLSGTAGE